MSFINTYNNYSWEDVKSLIFSTTERDVERVLQSSKISLNDFAHLLSPVAEKYIERIAQKSNQITQKRFGKTIQMYVPLYLSNECQNICTYCGFSFDNKIKRTTLTDAQIIKEIEVIKSYGYDHVLLVTGEANMTVGVDYLLHSIEIIKQYFSLISIEVQPLDEDDYIQLHNAGVNSVLVYQETYHKAEYKKHHPKGKKSNFEYRLDTPDRLGRAGIHKIGLGVLLGLEEWRVDSFFCALHLEYLKSKYWKTKYAISFPRLRPAIGVTHHPFMINDKQLVQLIGAWRLLDENIEISLSTRESEKFRDNIIPLGVTSFSAGSKTNPGGYSSTPEALEQFEISDERTPEEVARMIESHQYIPIWKDWDKGI